MEMKQLLSRKDHLFHKVKGTSYKLNSEKLSFLLLLTLTDIPFYRLCFEGKLFQG